MMARPPTRSLEELIAQTPGAQSRAEADAHLTARRKALGVEERKVEIPDDAAIGRAEPLPPPVVELEDPPPKPVPKPKPAKKPKANKPTPGSTRKKTKKPHLDIIVRDENPPDDGVK